jgi:hypothetical protein
MSPADPTTPEEGMSDTRLAQWRYVVGNSAEVIYATDAAELVREIDRLRTALAAAREDAARRNDPWYSEQASGARKFCTTCDAEMVLRCPNGPHAARSPRPSSQTGEAR